MAYKVYEMYPRGGEASTYPADTLDEAVEIIARERNENTGGYNEPNTFRLVELTETEIPIRISIGGGERGAQASCGDVTVTA